MATSLIQKKDGSSTSATALVVTLDALPQSGNTLVVAVVNNGGYVTSITGGGVTWGAAVVRSGSHVPAEIWAGVVTGTPAAAITINVPVGAIAAKVMEWSGGLATDVTALATNISTTIDPSAITPTANNTLVVAVGGTGAAISAGPTGGFTDQTTVTPGSLVWMGVGSLLQGTAAPADTTWTIASTGWDAVIASFIYTPTVPQWVSPADTAAMGLTPVLVFTSTVSASAQHFELQLDTASSFNSGNLRDLNTQTSQTGWEYFDGSVWQPFPSTGLPSGNSGNQVRHTVQSALSMTTWYRQVRAGV